MYTGTFIDEMMRISSRSTSQAQSNIFFKYIMFDCDFEVDKKDCVQSDQSDATGTSWIKHPIIKKKENY